MHAASDTHGVSLVESDTLVGDTTLLAGTFLISLDADSSIYHFTADDVGAGTTTGTLTETIRGSDIGMSSAAWAVDLVESTMTIGDETLQSGYVMASLETGGASVGNNGITVDGRDIFYLDVTTTGPGTTAANATLLLDGSDVNLDSNNETLDGFTIHPGGTNVAPSIIARETVDNDGNGQIDYIKITTNENLDDDFSGLTMTVAGYDVFDRSRRQERRRGVGRVQHRTASRPVRAPPREDRTAAVPGETPLA